MHQIVQHLTDALIGGLVLMSLQWGYTFAKVYISGE